MNGRNLITWVFIFTLLSGVTYWVLTPHDGVKEAPAYHDGFRHAVVVPREQLYENIWQRLLARLVQKELVCPVNAEQFAYLSEQYDVETDEISVGGETVTLLKVDRDTARRGAIMRYPRRENGITACTVVSSRSWYYLVFTGTVS